MIARLLISSATHILKKEITNILNIQLSHSSSGSLNYINHPDLLYYPPDSKLGISEARQIKEHFSLKPYSAVGRVVVLENASCLTTEAQNALLKTLEELPDKGLLLMGAQSDSYFLPTVLSRCQIIRLQGIGDRVQGYEEEIEKLEKASLAEKFGFVEKLKEKEAFLKSMVIYFHKNRQMGFLRELLQAEKWTSQNVNIRAILEYLMLVMPSK